MLPALARPAALTFVLGGAVAGGIALRVWLLTSPLGALDADEAVSGLMARRALDGDFSALYWGATYGGPQEALLTALVFAVTGSSTLVLKLVALTLFTLAALLVWRLGLRTVGEPAARLAAVLFWVWPGYFVWWTLKSRGYYAFGVLAWLGAALLVLRLRERDSRLDAAALGLVLGLGWWATPQVAMFALPLLAWLVWRRPAVLRLGWLTVAAFLAGASSWIAWNVVNDWVSLRLGAVAGEETSYVDRLVNLFQYAWPTWLGLRVPYSLEWLLGPVVGIAAVTVSLAALALLLVRRPPGLGPLLAIAAAFPFLYAASTFAYYVDEPRYLVLLAPVPALLLARLLARRLALSAAALAVALALSLAALVEMERDGLYAPLAPDVRVPASISPLLAALEREGADRVLANYWLAYRINFESRERLIATTPDGFVRDQPADRLVRSAPFPARVFLRGSAAEPLARPTLAARGYRRIALEDFVLYVH